MNKEKIAVLGGDGRQKYLISALESNGYYVSAYGVNDALVPNCQTLYAALSGAYAVILPFPLTPDGVFLNANCESCNILLDELFETAAKVGVRMIAGGGFKDEIMRKSGRYPFKIFDYGKNEELLLKNALCTAEGAIEIALRELPSNVHGSLCTVIGYGRIGAILSKKLRALGANVTTVVRREESAVSAECDAIASVMMTNIKDGIYKSDVIFNTVPVPILNGEVLSSVKKDALIIDLASAPGGVDLHSAERLGIKVIWALSLPGKVSPKSAASAIAETVVKELEKGEY